MNWTVPGLISVSCDYIKRKLHYLSLMSLVLMNYEPDHLTLPSHTLSDLHSLVAFPLTVVYLWLFITGRFLVSVQFNYIYYNYLLNFFF